MIVNVDSHGRGFYTCMIVNVDSHVDTHGRVYLHRRNRLHWRISHKHLL